MRKFKVVISVKEIQTCEIEAESGLEAVEKWEEEGEMSNSTFDYKDQQIDVTKVTE